MSETQFNPSKPLKPVWIDKAYLSSGREPDYVANWQSIPPADLEKLVPLCDRLDPNDQGTRFGYKGSRLINDLPTPRNVLCINAAGTEAWADLTAFPDYKPEPV
jgi:hypothetical protein